MIYAYDKIYLEKARVALGWMLDFAVHDLGYEITEFYRMFLMSGLAKRFGEGDVSLIAGRSGFEIAFEVLACNGHLIEKVEPRYIANRSPEYWAGWAVAYYQWSRGLPFMEIDQCVSIEEIVAMYQPYHEMDILHFCDEIDRLYKQAMPDTCLALRRKWMKISQRDLAERSGISVRTIQQYEQRQKNINKAQGETLLRLARVLFCNMEDLIEKVG